MTPLSSEKSEVRVLLLRDHPAEGWLSMDRYAERIEEELHALAPPTWSIRMPMPPEPWSIRYGQLAARVLRYPRWASRQQADVYHILDHSYGHLLSKLDPDRTVVTVHDVAPLRFGKRGIGFSRLGFQLAWRGVQRAKHLIADSQFTAAELQSLLDLSSTSIHVIPIGVSSFFRPLSVDEVEGVRSKYLTQPGENYILLHVGHTQPRKNFPALLDALAILRGKGCRAILIQVGSQPDAVVRAKLQDLNLQAVVHFAGKVSDSELVALYNVADVFTFPSLYEGFGLPVLEAMACGTPVVTSNRSSLPEVAGDCGVLVDPGDPADIAEGILQLLSDEGLRERLSQCGLERAAQFTWARMAQEILDVYRLVIEDR